MKKLLSLLLALGLVATLAACGSKDDKEPEDDTQDPSISSPNVGEEDPTEDEILPEAPAEGETGGDAAAPPATPPANGGNSQKPATGGTNTSPPASPATPPADGGNTSKGDLSTLMNSLLKGTESEMSVMTESLTADTFKANLFIDYIDGAKAVSSSAMMSAVAHSVVLLELPAGSDAKKVADQIDKNKDPRKWVCVEAEKSVVLHSGNYVLLAMSTTSVVDTVTKNFKANF